MKLSEADRIAYRRHYYDLHYLASMALYSDYGIAKQEGRKETLEQTALKMLNKGMSPEVITEITGLAPEQIEQLRKGSNRVSEAAAPYAPTRRTRKPGKAAKAK